ncbi:MAG: Carbamoyl-phosphate synthase large chain [Actinobacteria bacterium ADurb.Bin444]|nr:MAG: Carbamoyl-phosphate synthase large chain [Actinobacteria bacterium ADurb.Bin444]
MGIPAEHIATIEEYTRRIAITLGVVGLMNIQYAIADDVVYVLEANPRASRTVPLVSKVCNVQMAHLATQLMLGAKLPDLNLKQRVIFHFGVKEAVFPFNMFPEVDPLLGPEMRSTGEVLGMADSFGLAFAKSQEAAQQQLPQEGTVLITVAERDRNGDRDNILEAARQFHRMGFAIRATGGTRDFLAERGVPSEPILKLREGRPNIEDAIKNAEIQLVVNTPHGTTKGGSPRLDGYEIRTAAVLANIPCITTVQGLGAAVQGIEAVRGGEISVCSLQDWAKSIS